MRFSLACGAVLGLTALLCGVGLGSFAADPLLAGDQLLLSSSSGCALFQMRDGPAAVLWAPTLLMRNCFNPAVLLNGHLYGLDGSTHWPNTFACPDCITGQVRWSGPGFGSSGRMASGDKLIVFDQGQLSLIRATPATFQFRARAQVLGGRC